MNQKIGNVPKVNTVIVLPSESGHRGKYHKIINSQFIITPIPVLHVGRCMGDQYSITYVSILLALA